MLTYEVKHVMYDIRISSITSSLPLMMSGKAIKDFLLPIRLARRLIHHPDHVESPHCETTLSILNSNWNKQYHVRLCVLQGKAKPGSVMRA